MHKSLQHEKKLLELQAEALRLKLLSNQMRRAQEQSSSLLNLATQLPKAGMVWRLANMPRKLRNKLLVGAGILGLAYLRLR